MSEREVRHVFGETEKKMLNWLVYHHDERNTKNAVVRCAADIGVDTSTVKGIISNLEERWYCEREKVFTMAVKAATLSGYINTEGLLTEFPGKISAKERLVMEGFGAGYTNSEMLELAGIRMEDLNKIRGQLFRKFGTNNRYYIIASLVHIQKINK